MLRSLLVIDAPGPLPAANLRALRDTVDIWRPGASEAASFFPNELKMLPQVRAYLFGLLSVRLRDTAAVDSSVVAAILSKAIGTQLSCIFVDNGLLRKGEAEKVRDRFQNHFKTDLHVVDARAHRNVGIRTLYPEVTCGTISKVAKLRDAALDCRSRLFLRARSCSPGL